MNIITQILAAIAPIVTVGGPLTSWLVSVALVIFVVCVVVWCVTKFAGPPSVPEPYRWIVWIIVGVALLYFIFAVFGLKLP